MTDKELLYGLAKKEEKSFRFLYQHYYTMIEYLVVKNSGSQEQASDLFQELMVILFEKARDGQLELKASMKTICYSIARNLWLKELRKAKKEIKLEDFEQYITMPDEEGRNEEEFEDQQEAIKASLEQMGPPCQPLLIEFYYGRKSLKELAQKFGYQNTNSVKTQKYKCFRKLQKMALAALQR